MKCRDCKWMYSNETMGDLYICVNGKSENLGNFTGICCEDDCDDGESWGGDDDDDDWDDETDFY